MNGLASSSLPLPSLVSSPFGRPLGPGSHAGLLACGVSLGLLSSENYGTEFSFVSSFHSFNVLEPAGKEIMGTVVYGTSRH